MYLTISRAALVAAALSLPAISAHAHVTLEAQRAKAGSTYKAILRIPHGCEGSPTTTIKVQIPENVGNVKPMLKPGWQVMVVKARLTTPHKDRHGHEVTERVSEVHWSGGHLPDSQYDEFVMRVALPDKPGETIYFPVVQECEKGANRWIEIPAEGKTRRDYRHPAPQLVLTPKK